MSARTGPYPASVPGSSHCPVNVASGTASSTAPARPIGPAAGSRSNPLLDTALTFRVRPADSAERSLLRMADRELVAHILRRATFGPTRAEIDGAARLDLPAVVRGLVKPSDVDSGAVALPVFADDPYFGRTKEMTRAERQQSRQAARQQLTSLAQGWLLRMAGARHQLAEKMVFFWHGHWATSAQKVRSATLMRTQLETFRSLGRADFGTFARAMVRDPALIFWLDGQRNTRQAPNENLAREFMELFTLGIGAYGEDDVKAGAKALTGWTLDRATGKSVFNAKRYADGPKTILGVTKDFDVDSYVDLLVSQEAHPRFLAARLWYRFGSVEP